MTTKESSFQTMSTHPINQNSVVGWLKSLYHFRFLLRLWIWEEFRKSYHETRLGYLLIFLEPIAMVVVFTVSFGIFARLGPSDLPYEVFFLSGWLPWRFTRSIMGSAPGAVISNLGTMKKAAFPRDIVVIAMLISQSMHYVVGLLILVVLFILHGIPIQPTVIYLIPLFLLQLAFSAGIGFWFATIGAFYRDIRSFNSPLIRALTYASAIMYPLSRVPEDLLTVFLLNPIASMVKLYRDVLINGSIEFPWTIPYLIILSIVLLVTGYWYFHRREAQFADIL